MLRLNRSRLIGIFCVLIFVYFLVFTDSGSSGSEFRANTEAGLLRKQQREQDLPLRGHLSDEDLTKKTNNELQAILAGQSKEPIGTDEDGKPLGRVIQEPEHDRAMREKEGSPREEPQKQKEINTNTNTDKNTVDSPPKDKPKYPRPVDPEKASKKEDEEDEAGSGSDPGKDFAREKLMEYLKNPVVIFSKSYCPHSRRAKQLLLEVYNIVPKPLVVELDMLGERVPTIDDSLAPLDDEHKNHGMTLGKALQELLAEITGRKTVPNIVVGGHHSIGGNDRIWDMHEMGALADTIKKFGGRKIVSVDVNEED